jgi:hypothetical protein
MRLDGFADLFGRGLRPEALQDLAVSANQEFREIPGDVFISLFVGVARFEELIDVRRPLSIDIDLREERKVGAVLRLCELQDLH